MGRWARDRLRRFPASASVPPMSKHQRPGARGAPDQDDRTTAASDHDTRAFGSERSTLSARIFDCIAIYRNCNKNQARLTSTTGLELTQRIGFLSARASTVARNGLCVPPSVTFLDFILYLVIAGICGAIARAFAGGTAGGFLISILVGFLGAFLGVWIAHMAHLPRLLVVTVQGHPFPIVWWSIIGGMILVALVHALLPRRRYFYR